MNQTLQSGNHPDAESLNAFIEQALPPTEREQVIAHMANCGRCRQIVYLAQDAAGVDSPELNPAVVPDEPVKAATSWSRGKGWFGGWRLAWIPVAALAGFIGVAVVQHARRTEPEQRVAGSAVREQIPSEVPRGQKEDSGSSVADIAETKKANARPTHLSAPVAGKDSTRNSASLARLEPSSQPALQTSPIVATRSESTMAGLLKGEPGRSQKPAFGGPRVADQVSQQQTGQQQKLDQNSLQAARLGGAGAGSLVSATSRADGDGAELKVKTTPAANAPALISEFDEKSISTGNFAVAAGKVSADQKAKSVLLPNGRTPLSSAIARERAVAIDPSGQMYFSEDAGDHWLPVARQWTGRAVLVRTPRPVAQDRANVVSQDAMFELVNDNLQTWISVDGRNWVPVSLPLQK